MIIAVRVDLVIDGDLQELDEASVTARLAAGDTASLCEARAESVDWRTRTISASVRYTTADQWLRIKDVSTKTELPSDQFRI
jgi:hypothetical protein